MKNITLANGTEIGLLFKGCRFLGLGRIKVAGVRLRKGDVPVRPVWATMDGILFDEYEDADITQEGSMIVIRARAVGRWRSQTDDMVSHWWPVRTGMDYLRPGERFEGRLEWRLEPKELRIGDTTFSGFLSRVRAEGPSGKFICRLEEQSTWELGGSVEGNTLVQRCYYSPEKHEVRLGRAMEYSTSGRPKKEGFGGWAFQYSMRWGGSISPCDFLFNEKGTLIRLWERPTYLRSWLNKPAGDDRLGCFDEHYFQASQAVETVGGFVGFARADRKRTLTDARNLWTDVMDYCTERACEWAGTRPFPILPMMNLPSSLRHPFRQTADTMLEPAADLGFKVVWFHPFWDSNMNRPGGDGNGCGVYDWKVAEELGGEAGLKYLVDKAHALGLLVIAWCGGLRHGIGSNAWTREHPGWIARYINGREFGSGYDGACCLDMNRDEAYRYVIETCRGVMERTGLDGYFWDSYVDAWLEVVSPWDLRMKPAFERVVQMTAELQKMCRYFTVEAQGVWARPCVGNGIAGVSCIEGCQYTNYGRFFGNIESARPDVLDFYFRNLAYGAGSVMEWYELDKVLAAGLADGLRAINRAFLAAQPHMGRRRLLENDPGVEWISSDGKTRVFFCFQDGEQPWAKSGPLLVRQLPDGVPQPISEKDPFLTKARHVYLIENLDPATRAP